MTLDTYSHFLPSMGDQTVKAMEAALSSGTGRQAATSTVAKEWEE
jgi:hypothetical protein